mmetsp:Transcript_90861/g.211418  ORF Transcript_90861/g.211418 Transcript_90861/m.211418 type:complete len:212 (-) Transcript_90861:1292-1927(-)
MLRCSLYLRLCAVKHFSHLARLLSGSCLQLIPRLFDLQRGLWLLGRGARLPRLPGTPVICIRCGHFSAHHGCDCACLLTTSFWRAVGLALLLTPFSSSLVGELLRRGLNLFQRDIKESEAVGRFRSPLRVQQLLKLFACDLGACERTPDARTVVNAHPRGKHRSEEMSTVRRPFGRDCAICLATGHPHKVALLIIGPPKKVNLTSQVPEAS